MPFRYFAKRKYIFTLMLIFLILTDQIKMFINVKCVLLKKVLIIFLFCVIIFLFFVECNKIHKELQCLAVSFLFLFTLELINYFNSCNIVCLFLQTDFIFHLVHFYFLAHMKYKRELGSVKLK